MNFQFAHPVWLLLLPPALAWVVWLAWKTDVQIGAWRRWTAMGLRLIVVTALILAMAGFQWLRSIEGMNVFFLLDRSDSIPPTQQERARRFVNEASAEKQTRDEAGVVIFGADAAIETLPNELVGVEKIQAVVSTERSDMAAAIRLGTAAFPETGQKRLVLLSDGNENLGEALAAVLAARQLDVTLDVLPLGMARTNDVSLQRLSLPGVIKEGQPFEVKIFVDSDQDQTATLRLYRNDEFLGSREVELAAGKNLFSFSDQLVDPNFYNYQVQIDAAGDAIPQNNRAAGFTTVRGDPRILIISADPEQDRDLVNSLQSGRIDVRVTGIPGRPANLAEMQSYDSIFLSNVAAGDLGEDWMELLESAVRDFGVGLVCVGGDQTYMAGGYRGTPLETTLPVNMELDSKKVLPSGALVMVMHGMEFANGNQIAREIGIAALESLGPQDELGVALWDGSDSWLFPLAKVGNKAEMRRMIAGMNQGDMPSFQNIIRMANEALQQSSANLKHMIVFSDGDPGAPSQELMQDIAGARITVSTVMIGGHVAPQTMQWIADMGNGRFYDVDLNASGQLPQIFLKESAVILKSAIFENPFKPQVVAGSEVTRGISPDEYPILQGYVSTSPKARAEIPLVTDKGDPLLAHWQFGLGRAVAFTSDAKAKWAANWLTWPRYQQFWTQIAQWSLRKIENADFTTEVVVDKGEGHVIVEAVDAEGNYRNFLHLQSLVVSPAGERETVRLEQTGPGRYEARFPTREVGAYVMNLMEYEDGDLRGSLRLGTSVNHSPEFAASAPNTHLLRRLAEAGGGQVLDFDSVAALNPFSHDRRKTFQPHDLWEWLLRCAILLFVVDVGIRRILIDRDEWQRALVKVKAWLLFWRGVPRPVQADESLAALLARRDQVRSRQATPVVDVDPALFQSERPADFPLFARGDKVEAAPDPRQGGRAAVTPKQQEEEKSSVTTTTRLLEAKRRAGKRK